MVPKRSRVPSSVTQMTAPSPSTYATPKPPSASLVTSGTWAVPWSRCSVPSSHQTTPTGFSTGVTSRASSVVCGTGSGRVTTYVTPATSTSAATTAPVTSQPAAPAGRGPRDDALDGRRTDVDRPRRLVARGVEGSQVEGLRRLGEPAADLDGRFAQDLADLARVQLAEVPQHDGDAGGLVHPAEPVGDPLQQGELLLQLLGEHPARGHRLALALGPGLPRSRTQASSTVRASSTSTSPSRRSRAQSGRIRANAATASSSARSGGTPSMTSTRTAGAQRATTYAV